MCVAGLNVSTQPCNHRWYQLVRPCHPGSNLAQCPQKLRLEGWEARHDVCPWCDGGADLPDSTHKLIGSALPGGSAIPSPATSEVGVGRPHRSGSGGTLSSLSRRSSSSSTDVGRGQRHREMNDRLARYLTTDPHEVLPSARKNYPTSPFDESDGVSLRSPPGLFGRGWRNFQSLTTRAHGTRQKPGGS